MFTNNSQPGRNNAQGPKHSSCLLLLSLMLKVADDFAHIKRCRYLAPVCLSFAKFWGCSSRHRSVLPLHAVLNVCRREGLALSKLPLTPHAGLQRYMPFALLVSTCRSRA